MSGFTNLVSDLRAFRDNDSDRDARLTREEVSQALEMLGVEHQKEGLETMLTKAKLGQFLDVSVLHPAPSAPGTLGTRHPRPYSARPYSCAQYGEAAARNLSAAARAQRSLHAMLPATLTGESAHAGRHRS